MLKEYFWLAIIGVLLNATLIIVDSAGFLPFNLVVFGLTFFGIFLLGLYRPVWVFWLFIISLPLESVIISSNQIPISFRPFQMIGLMLFLATLFLLFFKIKKRKLPSMLKFDKSKFFQRGSHLNFWDSLVLALCFLSFVSLQNALDFGSTLKLNLVLTSFAMLYFLSKYYLQTKQRKLEALWFFLTTSLPILIFGIYQSVAFKKGWVDFQVFAERSNGTFTEPDWFGIYLVFLVAIVYWLKLQLFKTKNTTMISNWELRKVGQWFLNFYLFLIFIVLILTVARSAWVGFVAVSAIYFFLLLYQKKAFNLKRFLGISFLKESLTIFWVGLLSIFIVVAVGLSNFNLVDRASSSLSGLQEITITCRPDSEVPNQVYGIEALAEYNCRHINLNEIEIEQSLGQLVKKVYRPDPNIEIRKNIYQTTWTEIKNHWLIGQGLGSSAVVLGVDSFGHGLNASNIFLEIWFSLGVLGLIVFGALLLSPIFLAFKNLFGKSISSKDFSFFIILTGIALIIPNLFNAGIFLVILWVWLAVIND